MNVDILWSKFLTELKNDLTSLSFETWFKDTQLYKQAGNSVCIPVIKRIAEQIALTF